MHTHRGVSEYLWRQSSDAGRPVVCPAVFLCASERCPAGLDNAPGSDWCRHGSRHCTDGQKLDRRSTLAAGAGQTARAGNGFSARLASTDRLTQSVNDFTTGRQPATRTPVPGLSQYVPVTAGCGVNRSSPGRRVLSCRPVPSSDAALGRVYRIVSGGGRRRFPGISCVHCARTV